MVCANIIIGNFMSEVFYASQNHSSFHSLSNCILPSTLPLLLLQSLILGPHPPVQPAKPGAVLIRQIRAYVSVLYVLCNDIDMSYVHTYHSSNIYNIHRHSHPPQMKRNLAEVLIVIVSLQDIG